MDVPGRQRQLTSLPGSTKKPNARLFCGTSRVFYASMRPKRLAFSQKTRQGDQNAARFQQKCVRTTKTSRVFVKNAPGQAKCRRAVFPQRKSDHHPKRFSSSRHDFAEHPHGWCFPKTKAAATTAPSPPSRTSRPTLTRVHHSTPTGVRHSTPIRVSHSTPTRVRYATPIRVSNLIQHNVTKNRSGVLGQRPKPCWERVRVWERENPASEVEGFPSPKNSSPASKREIPHAELRRTT